MSSHNKGTIIREAHYPGRAPIEAYGNGGFRFAGMSHRGSVLCLPSGIYAWEPKEPGMVSESDLGRIFSEANDIQILLVGMGIELKPLTKTLRARLRGAGISADPMSTGAAVRTFNVLLAEDRAVAAVLMAVE
jgi:uncharacterized protein